MDIQDRLISEIKPYGKNAKVHPAKQIDLIAKSISEFGFNQPIVVDKDDIIIVGHGRYFAATKLGLEKIPVTKVEISEEQAKAYRLADNKLNESEWDMELVVQELKELSVPMIDLTGFDRDLILENNDKDDEVPDVPVDPRSKLGDVYQIGTHRLLCGDSTKIEDVEKLMDDKKADMVFTDPPYNVNYSGRGKETSNTIENDNMSVEAFKEFLRKTFEAYKTAVKISAPFYICHSSSS